MLPRVTVLMLNWRRPENVARIVDALHSQSAKPLIFMWDNAQDGELAAAGVRRNDFDWYVRSSENVGCMPRWWMAERAETDVVMTCDDDIMPADKDLVNDAICRLLEQPDPWSILTAFGRVLDADKAYEHCRRLPEDWVEAARGGEDCDVALGRMMLLRTDCLRRLRVPHWDARWSTCDDIVVSGMMAGGRRLRHWCSTLFQGRLTELPDHDAACREPLHFHRREVARRAWCADATRESYI